MQDLYHQQYEGPICPYYEYYPTVAESGQYPTPKPFQGVELAVCDVYPDISEKDRCCRSYSRTYSAYTLKPNALLLRGRVL